MLPMILGGLGMGIGGSLISGLSSAFGGYDPNEEAFKQQDKYTSKFDALGQEVGGRGIGRGIMGQQQSAVDLMRQAALGRAPSQAENLMQAGLGQSARNLAAGMAGSPSMSPALAASLAGKQSLDQQMQMMPQLGALRAGEMAQARGMLGSTLGQMRGQQMQEQGLNDAMTQFYMNQGFSRDEANRQAQMQLENLRAGQAAQTQQMMGQFGGGLASAGAGMMSMGMMGGGGAGGGATGPATGFSGGTTTMPGGGVVNLP